MTQLPRLALPLLDRVYLDTPPVIFKPSLPQDLSGFSTVHELSHKICDATSELFPFDRQLALYLLLIASLWPDDFGKLLTAARLFSGTLNFTVSRSKEDGSLPRRRRHNHLGSTFTCARVASYNKALFDKIGGKDSLLFCQDIDSFHCAIWDRVGELMVVHDVIEYLLSTSALSSRLSSLAFAYHAVGQNIFDRKGGYGIRSGPKRGARDSGTPAKWETVRNRVRNAPSTALLSFVLIRFYGLHRLHPASPGFLLQFANLLKQDLHRTLKLVLSGVAEQLLQIKAKQSVATAKWAASIPRLTTSVAYRPLSAEQLERVFAISNTVLKRPLSSSDKEMIRRKRETWWREIPRFRERAKVTQGDRANR